MTQGKKYLLIVCLFLPKWGLANGNADAILGEWYTDENKSIVNIYQCNEDQYCGRIIALKEPVYPADDEMAGQAKVDRNNPDEQKRQRSIVGLEILSSFQHEGDSKWEDGRIYDPNNGKTYKCIISLKDRETLKVRGYIGFSLIGRTTIWTRKPTVLQIEE